MNNAKELLNLLPSPIKEKALGYFDQDFLEEEEEKGAQITTVGLALINSFLWTDTEEGYDYWWGVMKEHGEGRL